MKFGGDARPGIGNADPHRVGMRHVLAAALGRRRQRGGAALRQEFAEYQTFRTSGKLAERRRESPARIEGYGDGSEGAVPILQGAVLKDPALEDTALKDIALEDKARERTALEGPAFEAAPEMGARVSQPTKKTLTST